MPDRPDIPEELVEKAGNVLETCEEERVMALLHARPGEQFYPVDRRIDARKALEAVADPLRNQGAEEERERLREALRAELDRDVNRRITPQAADRYLAALGTGGPDARTPANTEEKGEGR